LFESSKKGFLIGIKLKVIPEWLAAKMLPMIQRLQLEVSEFRELFRGITKTEPVADNWYLDEDGNWYFGAPPGAHGTARLAALWKIFRFVLLLLAIGGGIGVISAAIKIAIIWLFS